MLIPQFSIRWLLVLTLVCAGVFSILQAGLGGSSWATGVSIAIGATIVLLLVFAATFAGVWLFSLISVRPRRRRAEPGQSPFSQGTPAIAGERDINRDIDKDIPATPILLE